ncbi:acyl carrier protein [Kitasatospora sp. HPMI-4]|uniref:acyl carrier protein n=1 Tax=Kitasatospora sp. HPMI-4 TaxID=3448443 RepID=UPI003F1C6690
MTSPSPSKETIEEFVVGTLVKLGLDRAELTLDASFDDLGVDSLHVTELGQAVDRELGIRVRAADLEETRSLREALAVIFAKAEL